MKKKKLSLKGLEVKSFVTNLDGNLSNTVKGGDSVNVDCGGSFDVATHDCTRQDYNCIDTLSEGKDCENLTLFPACNTMGCQPGGVG